MKVQIKLLALLVVMLGLFIGTANVSFAEVAQPKVAIVDVAKVVAGSSQVKALKAEQVQKTKDLAKWLETANNDVKKQSTDANKQKLMKKYQSQFEKKREANQKAYVAELNAIDKSISSTIAAQAKAKGYDIVLSKSMVLVGGDDITAEIEKAVK